MATIMATALGYEKSYKNGYTRGDTKCERCHSFTSDEVANTQPAMRQTHEKEAL